MTESSGIFTFPQTGICKITVYIKSGFVSGSSTYSDLALKRFQEDSSSTLLK